MTSNQDDFEQALARMRAASKRFDESAAKLNESIATFEDALEAAGAARAGEVWCPLDAPNRFLGHTRIRGVWCLAVQDSAGRIHPLDGAPVTIRAAAVRHFSELAAAIEEQLEERLRALEGL